jgi:hypothetical protein
VAKFSSSSNFTPKKKGYRDEGDAGDKKKVFFLSPASPSSLFHILVGNSLHGIVRQSVVDFTLSIHYNYGNITPYFTQYNTGTTHDWIAGTLCKKTWIA